MNNKHVSHDFDDNGDCVHCGFDGGEYQHWLNTKKAELGIDEYMYRRKHDPMYQMPSCTRLDDDQFNW